MAYRKSRSFKSKSTFKRTAKRVKRLNNVPRGGFRL